MRLLACLLVLHGLVACQHQDSAERSAEITSGAPPRPAVAPPAPVTAAPATLTASAPASCGCGGGGTCGGMAGCSCGASCTGGGAAPTWAAVPADATWTALHVAGMHCGGCARRIERALAGVDGVLGVKVDLHAAKVEVATAAGPEGQKLLATTVKSTIDGLGYQVQ